MSPITEPVGQIFSGCQLRQSPEYRKTLEIRLLRGKKIQKSYHLRAFQSPNLNPTRTEPQPGHRMTIWANLYSVNRDEFTQHSGVKPESKPVYRKNFQIGNRNSSGRSKGSQLSSFADPPGLPLSSFPSASSGQASLPSTSSRQASLNFVRDTLLVLLSHFIR